MAKNKPVFPSNNTKNGNGQVNKTGGNAAAPTPKKQIRGTGRGQ